MSPLRITLLYLSALAATTSGAQTLGIVQTKPEGVRSVAVEDRFMVPYTATIPGTNVTFEMLPVPGGVVRLGPPQGKTDDDKPTDDGYGVSRPLLVQVDPFWIGKHEVTWAEYRRFMVLNDSFAKIQQLRQLASPESDQQATVAAVVKPLKALWAAIHAEPNFVDGVTSPTPLYYPDVTYESGEAPELPAVSMTQYAARQYTKWLSRISQIEHRLPSEAEWEYAARAGTDKRPNDLVKHAWHDENADYAAHHVGKLAPNAWGLHDTLGNAAEWVLDGLPDGLPDGPPDGLADGPAKRAADPTSEPIPVATATRWPTGTYPHIAKGGYWDAAAEHCRVAGRLLSSSDWKENDPNLPKSPWWFSDEPAFGVGFRVLRPLRPMDKATKKRVWEIDHQDLLDDVRDRLAEQRGKLEAVDANTPQTIEQLDSQEVSELIE